MRNCAKFFASVLMMSAFVAVFTLSFAAVARAATESSAQDCLVVVGGTNYSEAERMTCLRNVIAKLLAQIQQLQAQLAAAQGQSGQFCHTFEKNLRIGDQGEDTRFLNNVLLKEGFDTPHTLAAPGENFSELTASAVVAFQEKYRSEILTPSGLRNGTGYVGPATRRVLNRLYGCAIVRSGAPVITGIEAPTTLSVGQTGTWTVKAYDPENGTLSYSVRWGDEQLTPSVTAGDAAQEKAFVQTAAFTHAYASAGTYTATFLVKDNTGQGASMSVTVRVGGGTTQSSITVLSPNGGETWIIGSRQMIKWDPPYNSIPVTCSNPGIGCPTSPPAPARVDIFLTPYSPCEDSSGGCPAPAPNAGVSIGYYIIAENQWVPTSFEWSVGKVIGIQSSLDRSAGWLAPQGKYRISVCESGKPFPKCDGSNAPFTITSVTQSLITVLSPNGGELFIQGQTYEIRWSNPRNERPVLTLVDTSASPDYAVQFETGLSRLNLAAGATSTRWTVPTRAIPKSTYKIRVTNSGEAALGDDSDRVFTITSCESYGCAVIEDEGKKVVTDTPEVKALAAKYGWAHVHISALDIDLIKDIEFIRKLNPNFKEQTGCIIVVHAGEEGYVYQEDKNLQIIYKEPLKEFLERTQNVNSATMSKFYLSLH